MQIWVKYGAHTEKCFFYNFSCQATFTNHSVVPWSIREGFNYPIKSQLLTLTFNSVALFFNYLITLRISIKVEKTAVKFHFSARFLPTTLSRPRPCLISIALFLYVPFLASPFFTAVSVDLELKNQPPGLFGMFDGLRFNTRLSKFSSGR